jgi:hypothetical protein
MTLIHRGGLFLAALGLATSVGQAQAVPPPCSTAPSERGLLEYVQELTSESNEPDGYDIGLRGQSPEEAAVVKDEGVCTRARKAYNARVGTVQPPPSQLVYVVRVGDARYVVANADDARAHWRDWCVYDDTFKALGCIVG